MNEWLEYKCRECQEPFFFHNVKPKNLWKIKFKLFKHILKKHGQNLWEPDSCEDEKNLEKYFEKVILNETN